MLQETHRSAEHQVHVSQRIYIRLRRLLLLAPRDLWRSISPEYVWTVSHITSREIIRKTEVSIDHATVRIQEDVLQLDVPVHPLHPTELRDGRNLNCVLAKT